MRKLIASLFTICIFALSSMAMGHGEMKCGQGKCGAKGMNKSKGMGNYRAVPPKAATIMQEGENKNYGPMCGMTLSSFYKTNHAAIDENSGKVKQYCSIVCMTEDVVKNGTKLVDHKVVDNTTLKFIYSKDAYFVVGSNKPGTMSVVSKYAFGTKEAAQKFANENGGKIMRFDELFTMVKKGLQKDLAATKKRQAKAAKKGEMIYKKMCRKTDKRFEKVADAKSFLTNSGICGKIKGKKHQQVALFLSGKK